MGHGHINKFRVINNTLVLTGKNVLVLGGTAGIGAASAIRFAHLGASVTIAGRNKQNGAGMVAKMKSVSPCPDTAQFHYIPLDMTIIADVKRFTHEYMEHNRDGLSVLLITSGNLNVGPRKVTVDGVEYNFALCYLCRFLVINLLLPLLLRAPEGARVMSVLSAGEAGPIDFDDIEMNKPGAYSKSKSNGVESLANDFMVEELTLQNKDNNISFFHMHPGLVSTDILANNGVPLSSIVAPIVSLFATKPADYAEVVVHVATNAEFGPPHSGVGLDSKAQDIAPSKYQAAPGAREKLWNYSVETSKLRD